MQTKSEIVDCQDSASAFRPFFLRCLRLFTCMQLRLSKTCLTFTFLTTNALLMEARTLPDQSLVLLPSDSAFTCSLYIEIKRKQANWRFANTLRSSIWVLWCKSFLTSLFEKDKWQNSRDPLHKHMAPLHTFKPKSSPKPGYTYCQQWNSVLSLHHNKSLLMDTWTLKSISHGHNLFHHRHYRA